MLAGILALPVFYCAAIVADVPRWVRGMPGEWSWWRLPAPWSSGWLILGGALVVWILWASLFYLRPRVPLRLALATAVLMTGLLPYAALAPRDHPIRLMVQAVAAPDTGSFFGVAARIIDINQYPAEHLAAVGNYAEIHMRTSPPGIPLLFWGATRFFDAVPRIADPLAQYLKRVGCNPEFEGKTNAQVSSVILQLASPFIAGLALLPLFALARAWFGKRVALATLAAYPLLPILNGFAPSFNLIFLAIALTSLWLAWQAYRSGRLWLFALNGLFLSFASFLSFGNLVFVALDILMLLSWQALAPLSGKTWRRILLGVGALLFGVISLWFLYFIIWGISGLELYRRAISSHGSLDRTYWKWVLYNPYDFFGWLGLALWAPLLWYFRRSGSPLGQSGRRRFAISISVVAFSLALNFSGMVLGETARIVLFLAPLWLVLAMAGTVLLGKRALPLVLVGLALQTFVVSLSLWPILTDWRHTDAWQSLNYTAPVYQLPASAQPVDFRLGDAIGLEGFEYEQITQQVILYWRSLRPTTASNTAFVHIQDMKGQQVAGHDSPPQMNRLPTFCWQPGELVTDPHPITVSSGTYTLATGMYHWPDLQRLPVSPFQQDDVIQLGALKIGGLDAPEP